VGAGLSAMAFQAMHMQQRNTPEMSLTRISWHDSLY
jgi:hypothetical protein